MQLDQWGEFFLRLAILFAGVYVLIILTPKIAAFIDKRRKPGEEVPEAPRPERVDDDEITEKSDDDSVENDNNM